MTDYTHDLQTCCYIDSRISKHLFPGFHDSPRSEDFVPPSLTEPVKSDTSNTSDTSSTSDTSDTSAVVATQVFSTSSPSTHVLSSPMKFNFPSGKEIAKVSSEIAWQFLSAKGLTTLPPFNTAEMCERRKGNPILFNLCKI